MRVRVLVLGLAFFGLATLLAVQPYLASGTTRSCRSRARSWDVRPDLLQGTAGNDVICGRGGADTIGGNAGNDIIRGGGGSDRLQGDSGSDVLLGEGGNDWLWARDGQHDHVKGGRGYDRYRYDQSIDRLRSVEALM